MADLRIENIERVLENEATSINEGRMYDISPTLLCLTRSDKREVGQEGKTSEGARGQRSERNEGSERNRGMEEMRCPLIHSLIYPTYPIECR